MSRPNFIFWGTKGFWAIIDQGTFAISNFAISLLMARWLSPHEYGAFALSFTVFLLFGNIHGGLLIEPMLVFGKSKYRNCLGQYLKLIQCGHWIFSVFSSTLFIVPGFAAWYAGMEQLAFSLWGFAIASPPILFLWLTRRFCYVDFRPELAARGGVIYLSLMCLGIYLLNRGEVLSVFSALCVIGIASLCSAVWILSNIKTDLGSPHVESLKNNVWKEHRSYGTWASSTNILMWLPGNICFLILPLFSGLEAAGALKALLSLIMPIQQAFAAIGTLLIPLLVTVREGTAYMRVLYSTLGLLVVTSLFYWALALLFNRPVVAWLYNGKYDSYADLLWLLGLLPILATAVTVFGSSMRALEKPDRAFWAYAFSSAFSITIGLAMMALWGILGATLSLVFSYVITASFLVVFHLSLNAMRVRPGFRASLEASL
jgi:O-antigen/teichoic acid export membrane protein